jgi:hypothetical protein
MSLQIVGSLCAVCQTRIGSVMDGGFCPECGCPVCVSCFERQRGVAAQQTCHACGAPPSAIETVHDEWAQEIAQENLELRAYAATRCIMLGAACLLGGVAASLFCTGVAGGSRLVVATGAFGIGIGYIIRGVILSMRRN